MTYWEFLSRAMTYMRNEPVLRKGQALSVELATYRPDISLVLLGTNHDCFYIDGNVPAYLEKVHKLWNKDNE